MVLPQPASALNVSLSLGRASQPSSVILRQKKSRRCLLMTKSEMRSPPIGSSQAALCKKFAPKMANKVTIPVKESTLW